MRNLKPLLREGLAKFIREEFPVTRKRSAFWFFTNEVKKNLNQAPPGASHVALSVQNDAFQSRYGESSSSQDSVKISKNRIIQMWRNMTPETKRKYFNMAELDHLRYKEQKSSWLSEIGALLKRYDNLEEIRKLAPTHDALQSEFLSSLEKLHDAYEEMIQTESTKMLYKDTIKKLDIYTPSLTTEDLISALPKHHKPILSKPRRPPAAFALFALENRERLNSLRSQHKIKGTNFKLAAQEWADMDRDAKQVYEDRYQKLKDEYDEALEQYRSNLSSTSDDYLELASREKKNFRRSLRKRLRKTSVLPLSIRNPFNFFAMEHKDSSLASMTEAWRNMSLDEKEKYVQMNEEDAARYKREIAAYQEIMKVLNEMFSRRAKEAAKVNQKVDVAEEKTDEIENHRHP